MQANGIFRRLVGTAHRLDYKYKIAGSAFDYMAFDSAVGRFVDSIFERKKRMKGKKKCLSLFVALIGVFIMSLCFPVYAEEYGAQYPSYVNQSGGCFIECQSNLGKGTLILPMNYCKDTFGFSGQHYNVMNITNSTVSGYFVLENGTTYNARASSFNTFQYQSNDDYYSRWYDLTVSKIYNTNAQFIDNNGDRGNIIFNFSLLEWFLILEVVVLALLLIVNIWNICR